MGYCIYKHTNKVNGKVYIGQTCQKPERRWREGEGYSECVFFYNAIKKYGWDNFTHEILYENLSKDEADKIEISLIKKEDSRNPKFGYNLREGGGKGRLSEETKKKISLSESGSKNPFYGKHHTKESRRKMSEYRIGKHLSEETKKKMSESTKGKYSKERLKKMSERMSGENNPFYGKTHSEESKMKMSNSKKGVRLTEFHKKRISDVTKGNLNPMYGKHHSNDAKEKIAEATSKKVICLETGRVYKSIVDASKSTNSSYNGISKCCNGKLKSSNGFHWKFYKEGE